MAPHLIVCATTLLLLLLFATSPVTCSSRRKNTLPIGVCYGVNGDNLPAPTDVINLYKQNGIEMVRLYEPYPNVLQALRGSQLKVALGTKNEDLANLAGSQDVATTWVSNNVLAYNDVDFIYISLGNEVIPGDDAQYVTQAMKNIKNALDAAGLSIHVTTVVGSAIMGTSYPPSQGAFSSDSIDTMSSVVQFLASTGSPLMINVYPYFAYASDPVHISLEYAIFTAQSPVVHDGNLDYWSLFDAMVDAVYSAMEKVGGGDVKIAVAESGWPSAGNGDITTPGLAGTYNHNMMNHVISGSTPKRPGYKMDTFIFAMFNENLKAPGIEQNWGLFYPNETPVYPVFN
ncbi:glucan endo-1,3-beta-glucosidase-like [Tasmannia lanceolata]|uniref:glucan endo-1,3-beta-glucosidase-like n=1 Tax=Tasmannia lanceolata TaxID=3420 RepID=UPI0040638E20